MQATVNGDVAEIRKSVRRFIVENFLFGKDSPDFTDERSFLESGIIDSTGILELIEFIEQEYGISVVETETIPENLGSLSAVSRFIIEKKALNR